MLRRIAPGPCVRTQQIYGQRPGGQPISIALGFGLRKRMTRGNPPWKRVGRFVADSSPDALAIKHSRSGAVVAVRKAADTAFIIIFFLWHGLR